LRPLREPMNTQSQKEQVAEVSKVSAIGADASPAHANTHATLRAAHPLQELRRRS
jgi:hypothetical protein